MRYLQINLATRPFHNNLLHYAGYSLALILIGLFTFYNISTLVTHSETVSELEGQLSDGRARLAELQTEGARYQADLSRIDLKDLTERINSANRILVERDFSWTQLLNDLEGVQPYKARLLELRPLVSVDGILIEARGTAMDLENFWQLQEKLQAHPKFRRVYPQGYTRIEGRPDVFFTISFNYFPRPEEVPENQEMIVTPETVVAHGVTPGSGSAGGGEGTTPEDPARTGSTGAVDGEIE